MNNDIHVSSFLTKVNILYILAIISWLSYSVFSGTVVFTMNFDVTWISIFVTAVLLIFIGSSLLDGDWISAIFSMLFLPGAYIYFSNNIDFSFHISPTQLLYFEYASLVALAVNTLYTFTILLKAKLTYSLPIIKILSFIVILLVMVSLNILKTLYVINSVDSISLFQWSFLQVIGIMLVALANLFVRYLEVYSDELDGIKRLLRVDTIVFTLVLALVFLILLIYAKGADVELFSSLMRFNIVSSLDYYFKIAINFYNSMSLVEFNIMSSLVSMLIVMYILKFAFESISLLQQNIESRFADLGISYIMGLLFIVISASLAMLPTSHQFFESSFVMILLIPIVIIFRNIYSTRLILSVAFITFVLPFGNYIMNEWSLAHGFLGIFFFILGVAIVVPLSTYLIYIVGKISIVVSSMIYGSKMIQIILIAIGSSVLFFLRSDSSLQVIQ